MLLNGLPATELSLLDRGLAYGDGLFETLLVQRGRPVFLTEHLARLQLGCGVLGLVTDMAALRAEIDLVLDWPEARSAVMKIMLTRESKGRGYQPGTSACNRIIALHRVPDYSEQRPEQGIATFLCRQALARQPVLAGLKHLNRLEQVLASREWPDDSFLEGLMLDTTGLVIEGTRTNVFAVIDGKLKTPAVDQCGVAGVLRAVLLQHFEGSVQVASITLNELQRASEVFVCNSVNGIWPVTSLHADGNSWRYSVGDYARSAQQRFREALA
ncbi:MAG TPA: aminodeoxychorismate lyase [Candidatus Acidoferrum sp.]|nr:aminodeoxychorismate lyase [Candidatus Acidoferrum sp.]